MDETTEKVSQNDEKTKVLESPKPVAFTVDFGENRPLDIAKYKNLVEKYQQHKHRRGQSLSKIEEPLKPLVKKHPLTGNLPRKSGYSAEGYHSSDEKVDKNKLQGVRSSVLNTVIRKGDLSLPLKSITCDRMTQSFPSRSFELPVIDSPEIEIKDISSPELDLISPLSPLVYTSEVKLSKSPFMSNVQHSEESTSSEEVLVDKFKSCVEMNDKSDNVSEAGTYTIETDNYTEEQKQRMSIDKDFNIEQVSVEKKTQEYIQNLIIDSPIQESKSQSELISIEHPIISPITSTLNLNNTNKTAKVLNSNQHSKNIENTADVDRGVFTLVTTSGVLNKQQRRAHSSSHTLVRSVVALETYPSNLNTNLDAQSTNGLQRIKGSPNTVRSITQTLFAQNISVIDTEYHANLPSNSGSNSPSKLPSPIHTARNRNSYSSANCDFSDSSLETESYLRPTQNIITSLQQRLSLDSDSENDRKYNSPLNNEAKILLKHKPVHVRHNSFDDRNIKLTNKLENFHSKNFQSIDQTLKSCNQYKLHQIQNSPNNSPIRRSSSFSLKNQFDNQQKCLNTQVKDNNYRKLTNPQSSTSIQRSSSTANIKPKTDLVRRASVTSDSHERNNYLETESSSEEDYDKNVTKNKKDLTSTRYNRAFSLRRARLDVENTIPKCPNTPEMKRKFAPIERTVSVDRKSSKSVDVHSRYMNLSRAPKSAPPKNDAPKVLPKNLPKPPPSRQAFSRTDSGRFSLRSPKPLSASLNKPLPFRKDAQGKFPYILLKLLTLEYMNANIYFIFYSCLGIGVIQNTLRLFMTEVIYNFFALFHLN